MKILKFFKAAGSVLNSAQGGNNGIISFLKDKTGKISFKRSFPILLITLVAAPDIAVNGLTWQNIAVIAVAGAVYTLPKFLGTDSE